MKRKKWTFLSNHGRIFAYVTEHPQATAHSIANNAGLSIGGVQNILDDLEEEGYLTRIKVGRRNHYHTNPEKPMRHRLEKHHSVGDMLQALGVEPRNKEHT
jgi:DNA-binding MarR family transcriptional regulator